MPNTETVFVHVGEDPTGGSVAHWPMDEGAGTVTVDASGNGHHGTLVNGTRWVAGPALDFDGVDDHVDAGAFDVAGTALTLAARIRPRELANCGSVDCRILSKATGTAENDHYFMLSTIESGGAVRLRFRLKTDGVTSTLIASSGDLVDNVWYHVAAVYDGAEMLLYLDGQVVGSAAKTGELTTNAAVDVWIGGNPPGATDRPWEGAIDDVRIYDRALTAEEIAALP